MLTPLHVIVGVQNWRFNGYEMRMYDFGTDCAKADQGIPFYESCNQRKYGQNSPPVYNLTNIRAPIAVFSGRVLQQYGTGQRT